MNEYTYDLNCFDEKTIKTTTNQTRTNPVFCPSDSDIGYQIQGTASGTGGANFTNISLTSQPFSNGNVIVVYNNDQVPNGQYTVSSAAINDFDINVAYSGTPSTVHGTCGLTYAIESIQAGSGGKTQINITGQIFSNGDLVVIKNNDQIPDRAYTVSNAQINNFDINHTFESPSVTNGLATGVHRITEPYIITDVVPVPVEKSSTTEFSTTSTSYVIIPNSDFTPTENGKYYVSFSGYVQMKSSKVNSLNIAVFKEDAILSETERKVYNMITEFNLSITTHGIIELNAGETIDIRMQSSAGEAVRIITRNSTVFFVSS